MPLGKSCLISDVIGMEFTVRVCIRPCQPFQLDPANPYKCFKLRIIYLKDRATKTFHLTPRMLATARAGRTKSGTESCMSRLGTGPAPWTITWCTPRASRRGAGTGTAPQGGTASSRGSACSTATPDPELLNSTYDRLSLQPSFPILLLPMLLFVLMCFIISTLLFCFLHIYHVWSSMSPLFRISVGIQCLSIQSSHFRFISFP